MGNIVTRPTDNTQQPRRTYQFDSDGWRRTALRSSLTDAAKVLAAVLADNVQQNGTVSVPRAALADRCGCSDRQISERLKQLVAARFLDRVSAGKRGHTAVYRALRQVESARQDRSLPGESARFHLTHSPGTDTAEPRAFSEPLSVSTPRKRAAEPRTSSTQRQVTACASTSEVPSSKKERSAEVDPTPYPAHRQEREEGEPVLIGEVIPLLFRRGAA